MALIDALVDKVSDDGLRAALREQVDALLSKRSFGLVYQQHKPETVELPNHKVRRGCKVRVRDASDELFRVQSVRDGKASIVGMDENRARLALPVGDLTVVREFGEPAYPGLRRVDRIKRSDDKPSHVVLNAENYHALETLLYTHEEQIDAIYIDPPYNSGARDWKYNNDYVDEVDQYRHSKWLAFMQRRLALAKRLLNPSSSVLIVTIDEKEVHHLGMLLEQMFPEASQQMVTIVNNSSGQARKQELSRVEEYAFFLFFGDAVPHQSPDDLLNEKPSGNPDVIRWESLLRSGTNSRRVDRPNLFYPVFIDKESRSLVEIGEPKDLTARRQDWGIPSGTVPIWPIKSNGVEGRWKLKPSSLQKLFDDGFVKIGEYKESTGKGTVWYLGQAARKGIESGETLIVGRDARGAVIVEPASLGRSGRRVVSPATVWNRSSHHAGWHGSALLSSFLPGRTFPFPKSLYAVEDSLRIAVGSKPQAKILDFFAGSGTTAHAVARLNAEDSGRRQCILVTNNEVSVAESDALRANGYRPGQPEWERHGIFYQITKPRVTSALTGVTPDGQEVTGNYANDQPFAEGFDENVEFFELTYEDADRISLGQSFKAIAPLLWLKAGGHGACIDEPAHPWALPEASLYGVLFDTNMWRDFVSKVASLKNVHHVYIVTDSEATFQLILGEMPSGIECTQLYEDYLRTFQINTRSGS
jgi:adenine-specific DNA-methyltransferase